MEAKSCLNVLFILFFLHVVQTSEKAFRSKNPHKKENFSLFLLKFPFRVLLFFFILQSDVYSVSSQLVLKLKNNIIKQGYIQDRMNVWHVKLIYNEI